MERGLAQACLGFLLWTELVLAIPKTKVTKIPRKISKLKRYWVRHNCNWANGADLVKRNVGRLVARTMDDLKNLTGSD